MKKVVAIHDLSGIGKASLTAVMPILSSMKLQVCPLPTAVLSTITGVFSGYSFCDLTDFMRESITHWATLDINFDYIYSGFLGSPRQADIILELIEQNKSCTVFIDPVLGDNGVLYSTMDENMVKAMRLLVKKANVITPNLTEANFLLDDRYGNDMKSKCKALADFGPSKVVITSTPDEQGNPCCVSSYNSEDDEFSHIVCNYLPIFYSGTGDIFASVLLGRLANNYPFGESVAFASDFVRDAIDLTQKKSTPAREGVLLELLLDNLWEYPK